MRFFIVKCFVLFFFSSSLLFFSSTQASNGSSAAAGHADRPYWVLLEFVRPVTCPRRCKVIASRLDTDVHANACRLAFHGVLLVGFEEQDYATLCLPKLRIYKEKHKEGIAERVNGFITLIMQCIYAFFLIDQLTAH